MSLDIRYRPKVYSDVLGQDATITILKQFVVSGRGFQQSYLFCGGRGQGKTTCGRILARALLCEAPVRGEPCDHCTSCLTLLRDGSSVDFIEVDAATNSGKAEIDRIKESLQYNSFSGRQCIYLFDEAHQLTEKALDGLLKPTEDNIPGSENKWLGCIFCTTEPEKMRATVLSRCAPAFVIEPQPPEVIAGRLAEICTKEGIEFEPEALQLVAEITECHVRDALKAIEGISMLGKVDRAHVSAYLHLDLNSAYLDILSALGQDLPKVLDLARQAMQKASPSVCYERLADAAMSAFRVHLGVREASHWPQERLQPLATKGVVLLSYVDRFASRPGRPTPAMLLCDLAVLHYGGGGNTSIPVVVQMAVVAPPVIQAPAAPSPAASAMPPAPPPSSTVAAPAPALAPAPVPPVKAKCMMDDPTSPYYAKTVARSKESQGIENVRPAGNYQLPAEEFCKLLALSLAELRSQRGSPG
ncbi:MAG: hypothetical protein A2Y38_08190 [Spirochaetes bacterium GWB1_59_5]|nr:MAG: hypothetical protein A2Y38_08190 [Spirochaetes bacterium GWB1_59_5]